LNLVLRFSRNYPDLDKEKEYPINYVCLLPKTIQLCTKSLSRFVEIFGEDSAKLAQKMLTDGLEKETEAAIRIEIEERLRALQPKPAVEFSCVVCGATFNPKKFGRFFQRICDKCRNK
jgi:hypothetical protein